jgi:polysaccharide export outer membrane protein
MSRPPIASSARFINPLLVRDNNRTTRVLANPDNSCAYDMRVASRGEAWHSFRRGPCFTQGSPMKFAGFAVQTKALGKRGALLFGVLLCSAIPAKAEYRLEVGDVIEISVAGVPDLRQRVAVQWDGSISFPLLGTFVAVGLSPSEVRAKIQAQLSTKAFRQRAPDGRENVIVIEPDQVTAGVVEYRPIYVNGDVSRPGEQTFRPHMTVRQAVALSGGYELMRFRMNHPFLESADLRSDYETLWADFAKEQAHIWRMRIELGDKDNAEQKLAADAPISPSAIAQITSLEAKQLKTRQDDYLREKIFLQRGVKQSEEQIQVLTDQLEKEDQGLQADSQDLQRIAGLFGRGAIPMPRVSEARRAVLLSSTRKLQTTAQLMQLRKQRDDFTRQLERLDDLRRITLLRELQEAGVRADQLRAKLRSVGEKLQFTGLVKSQLVRGTGGKPEILIVRKAEEGRTRFNAEEDSELQPGDVVEVALRTEQAPVP